MLKSLTDGRVAPALQVVAPFVRKEGAPQSEADVVTIKKARPPLSPQRFSSRRGDLLLFGSVAASLGTSKPASNADDVRLILRTLLQVNDMLDQIANVTGKDARTGKARARPAQLLYPPPVLPSSLVVADCRYQFLRRPLRLW